MYFGNTGVFCTFGEYAESWPGMNLDSDVRATDEVIIVSCGRTSNRSDRDHGMTSAGQIMSIGTSRIAHQVIKRADVHGNTLPPPAVW